MNDQNLLFYPMNPSNVQVTTMLTMLVCQLGQLEYAEPGVIPADPPLEDSQMFSSSSSCSDPGSQESFTMHGPVLALQQVPLRRIWMKPNFVLDLCDELLATHADIKHTHKNMFKVCM
jgi:hypothetical protein